MNATTTKETKAKRPRKFAREPQGDATTKDQPGSVVSDDLVVPATEPRPADQEPKPKTKTTLLLELLTRPEGATLDQMVEASGWLPHTTRAALTGLKKKGHEVTSAKADGVRTYRLIKSQGVQATVSDEPGSKSEA